MIVKIAVFFIGSLSVDGGGVVLVLKLEESFLL